MGRGELVCSSSLTLEQVEEEWLAAQHHLRPRTRQFYRTNYVAYRIGDGPDAEDVTSESFARALRYRESFDGRRATRRMALARRMASHFVLRLATPGRFAPLTGVTAGKAC